MVVTYVVFAIVLAAVLVTTGVLKLVKEEGVVTTLTNLRVPLSWLPLLALLEFAGALGLLVGIVYRPLGIAASIGVILFFVGAVIAHLRAKDVKGAPVPATLLAVSMVPLILGLATV